MQDLHLTIGAVSAQAVNTTPTFTVVFVGNTDAAAGVVPVWSRVAGANPTITPAANGMTATIHIPASAIPNWVMIQVTANIPETPAITVTEGVTFHIH